METRRKKQMQKQKTLFTMTSGGFMIVVGNNSFIDSKCHSFEPYLVTVLKALMKAIIRHQPINSGMNKKEKLVN